ncbi:hypothetical protein N7495_006155 [Penicillium taxi]|uniref:uncharacterized protein n=1 Tax=Penicillium taxi TaxID=168475 RepID=UPI0025459A39|nr:uncharacterized protein N7495_006155 [Penicillium taxi]KAJ5894464.1 hypothetical protein N7495_006155 [Penicillium taxi]
MTRKAKTAIVALSTLIVYISVNSLLRTYRPSYFIWCDEDRDDFRWIATSRSWLDRKSCRWFGICGLWHLHVARGPFGHRNPAKWSGSDESDEFDPWRSFWLSGADDAKWDAEERAQRKIPNYVFDYAPLVHLYSGEQFWPSDIAEHLYHTTPALNYTTIETKSDHPTLKNLHELNQWGTRNVFLTSNDDVSSRPPWLEGENNIPQSGDRVQESWADWDGRVDGKIPGDTPEDRAHWLDLRHLELHEHEQEQKSPEALERDSLEAHQRLRQELRKRYGGKPIQEPINDGPDHDRKGGRSDAPAILLVMDKGDGVVDAFWFFFYSFNLGTTVFDVRFGNHIGDWEHCLVRFHHGQPKALFFSAHAAGEAYKYEAVEKIGKRPVIYSAEGSHAMYATPDVHPYILPFGILYDVTDRGPLWDPTLNSHTYTYDFDNDKLRASTFSPNAPTEWFDFKGHWGDKFYPLSDSRQYRFAGQYHFVNGPLGPRFKHLNRYKVCQGPDNSHCAVKDFIGEAGRIPQWGQYGTGE